MVCALQRFEPYVLVSKTKVPWYDERFTGYLQNKILHVRSMMHLDFTFVAHPDAFLVHYPHPPSKHKTLVLDHAGLKQEVTAACVSCFGGACCHF